MQKVLWSGIFLAILFSSCNLEKDIELELPPYEPEMVVESYLEPGKPFTLTLSESASYFEAPELLLINQATVVIRSSSGKSWVLKNQLKIDTVRQRFYNYFNNELVPLDYTAEYTLEIEDKKGRIATAKTKLLPPVKIDTVEYRFNQDSLAFSVFRFQDDPKTSNFYRVSFQTGSPFNKAKQRFTTTDNFAVDGKMVVGTGFIFVKNDTLFTSLYHIDKVYYDFLESVSDASRANSSPFGQPSSIKTNIKGGTGIFTFLSIYTKRTILNGKK
jgi:hypothetical protein